MKCFLYLFFPEGLRRALLSRQGNLSLPTRQHIVGRDQEAFKKLMGKKKPLKAGAGEIRLISRGRR